jgi:hypothetical protein
MEQLDTNSPIEWVSARQRFNPTPRPEPPIDKVVSDIVGKPIRVNNPFLIKLIVKWKKAKGDSDEPDNFMSNPEFIEELKKTFI